MWTLRIVLWTALLVIAFRGITAIISSSSPVPAGGTGPGTGGQFPVVPLFALLSGQLMELGVPVAATGGGLVVSAEPAWLPAPPRISPRPAPSGSTRWPKAS